MISSITKSHPSKPTSLPQLHSSSLRLTLYTVSSPSGGQHPRQWGLCLPGSPRQAKWPACTSHQQVLRVYYENRPELLNHFPVKGESLHLDFTYILLRHPKISVNLFSFIYCSSGLRIFFLPIFFAPKFLFQVKFKCQVVILLQLFN